MDAIIVKLAKAPAAARPSISNLSMVSPYSTVNMNWVSYWLT